MRLKHSFGIIALDAERTISLCLAGIYEAAHEIIVVEGRAGPEAAFMADADGGSLDGTVNSVLAFNDPQRKILLVRGAWRDKTEMSNEYARRATGDWLWEADADEVWDPEALRRADTLLADGDYDAVEVDFYHYWHDLWHVGVGSKWSDRRLRAWRRRGSGTGFRFDTHWPPTISGAAPEKILKLEPKVHHLSYDDAQEVERKILYHENRGYKNLGAWYRDVWLQWRVPGGEKLVRHPTCSGNDTGRVVPYDGPPRPVFLQRVADAQKPPARVLHVLPSMSAGGACRACYGLMELGPPTVHQKLLCLGDVNIQPGLDTRGLDYGKNDRADELLDWAEVIHVHWWRFYEEWPRFVATKKPILIHVVVGPWRDLCPGEFRRWHLDGEERDAAEILFVSMGGLKATAQDGSLPPEHRARAHIIHAGGDLIPFAWRRGSAWANWNGSPVVGVPGHFYNLKVPENHAAYLKAVHAAAPGAAIRLAGEGPWTDRYPDMGHWGRLLSFVADMPGEMATWSLMLSIYPRHSTCASELTLQEALAAGVPVVVRPSDALANFVHPTNGVVLPDWVGPDEVAQEVGGLLSDPGRRMKLGDAGRKAAFRTMGAAEALRKLVPMWRRLAGRSD